MLAVAIQNDSFSVETILKQEGIPYIKTDSVNSILQQGISIAIWFRQTDEIRRMLQSGVTVITTHREYAVLQKIKIERIPCYSFHSSGHPFTRNISGLRYHGWCYTDGSSDIGIHHDKANQPIIGSGIFFKDNLVSLPWDMAGLYTDTHWSYRNFTSISTDKEVVEVGPEIDKGAIRHIVFNIIKYFWLKNEHFLVRLFPSKHSQGNYVIRIDADDFNQESTDRVIDLAESNHIPFTWFIDVERHETNPTSVIKLKEKQQDIQLHCYHHLTYPDRYRNYKNMLRGKLILEQYGITPCGVVSPFGWYSRGFQKSLQKIGFLYSSEFGFDVDNLPYFPYGHTELQVPTHCQSIGVHRKAGFSSAEISEHWKQITASFICQGITAVIYDHPINRLDQMAMEFNEYLSGCRKMNWVALSMSEYADWWIRRNQIRFLPSFSGTRLSINRDDSEFWVEFYGDISIYHHCDYLRKRYNEDCCEDIFYDYHQPRDPKTQTLIDEKNRQLKTIWRDLYFKPWVRY